MLLTTVEFSVFQDLSRSCDNKFGTKCLFWFGSPCVYLKQSLHCRWGYTFIRWFRVIVSFTGSIITMHRSRMDLHVLAVRNFNIGQMTCVVMVNGWGANTLGRGCLITSRLSVFRISRARTL